jgi:uncharacterized protein (DUF1330 family)
VSIYMVIEIEVKDKGLYSEYVEKVHEVVIKHGGQYLVRGGQVTPLSGNWSPERVIIIEFETIEHLKRCFGSEEYRTLAPLRENSTLSRSIVVESCRPTLLPVVNNL